MSRKAVYGLFPLYDKDGKLKLTYVKNTVFDLTVGEIRWSPIFGEWMLYMYPEIPINKQGLYQITDYMNTL